MFTLTIPTGPINDTDEHAGFVIATMLREIADRIGGVESDVQRTHRHAHPQEHLPIHVVPNDVDADWQTETWRYASRFNDTLVGCAYELTAKEHP